MKNMFHRTDKLTSSCIDARVWIQTAKLVYGCIIISSLIPSLKLQWEICQKVFNKKFGDSVKTQMEQNQIARNFELDIYEPVKRVGKQTLRTSDLNVSEFHIKMKLNNLSFKIIPK